MPTDPYLTGNPLRPTFARADFPVRVGPVAFLGLALLSEIAGAFGLFSVSVLDVFIARSFHLSLTGMGITVAATSLGMTLGLAAAGPLSDRVGPRAVLTVGAVAMAAFAALLGSVDDFDLFLAVLVLYGAALTAVPASGMKAVFNAFAGRARGLPMGIRQTGTPIGAGLAALALPTWAPALGVGTIFRLIALLLLAAGWAFAFVIPGSFTATQGSGATASPSCIDSGGPTALRAIAWPLAVAFLMSAGQYDIAAFTLPDLGRRAGLAAAAAGGVLAAAQLGCGAGRIAFGLWSDRMSGDRPRAIWQAALLGVVAAIVAAAAPPMGLGAWAGVWFLFGLGAMGWNSLGTLWAAESVDPGRSGSALSAVAMVVMAGATIHPPLFGALADAGGFVWGWSMVALDMALAGALCYYATGRRAAGPR